MLFLEPMVINHCENRVSCMCIAQWTAESWLKENDHKTRKKQMRDFAWGHKQLSRPARSPGLPNPCIRAKIFVMYTAQSIWLTNCLQQLRKPQYLNVERLPNLMRSQSCLWRLAGRAHVQVGFLSNCNRTHTQTVQAKPRRKGSRYFHSQDNHVVLLWPSGTVLGLLPRFPRVTLSL